MKIRIWLLGLIFLAACQSETIFVEVTRLVETPLETAAPTLTAVEVTREVPVEVTRVVADEVVLEVTRAPLGTEARPVLLLFPPAVNTAVVSSQGQALADALTAATGYQFEVGVADDEAALIDLLCAAPQDTIGFLSAAAAMFANQRCQAPMGATAVHDHGYPWQTGMIVVGKDSGINALEDLAGKRWGAAEAASLPNMLYFQAMLADAGIKPGEIISYAGESDAILALYNGEVDFVTAAYVPPILPYDERQWVYGQDEPELWRELGFSPSRSPIGYVIVWGEVVFGGYQLRDARARIFDIQPEIYDVTRILELSARIPNETVVFGPDFPLALSQQATAVLIEFAASEACTESVCAADFYGWAGLQPADEALYEAVRFTIETLNLDEEAVLE